MVHRGRSAFVLVWLLCAAISGAAEERKAVAFSALPAAVQKTIQKLAGNAQWAYRLSRQILDFVMSPLPVAGLYVLLRVGVGTNLRQPAD